MASRPGCAGPEEGVGSPCLRPASPTPGERGRRRRAPAASPAASRCSPSLATLSVCLRYCLAESGGASADQHFCHVHRRQPAQLASRRITPLFLSSPVTARGAATTPERRDRSLLGCATPQQVSANTLAHPTIDVMQSSRARRVYSPLPLRLRLHNAGYYPTCQPVAAVHGRITLRGRRFRLRSGSVRLRQEFTVACRNMQRM